jgi:predicted nucleic acid-binding protein
MGSNKLKYLLDSVILIDHFNGLDAATAFLSEAGAGCALSVITRAEVLAGFDDETESLARDLLDQFITLPITAAIADRAAALRRSERWRLPDAFQAAVAVHHKLTLVTRNTRDFQPGGSSPKVLVPYRF